MSVESIGETVIQRLAELKAGETPLELPSF